MKKLLDAIADHYRGIEYQYAFFSLASLMLIFCYRISSYTIASKLYPNLSQLGLWKYISLSLGNDLFSAAIVLGIILLIVSAPKSWRLFPLLACNALVSGLALFVIFSLQFMKIYETSFQPSYLAAEQFSGIKGMLVSAAAEISTGTVVASVAAIAVILLVSLILLIKEAKSSLEGKPHFVYLSVLIYGVLVLCTAMAPVHKAEDLNRVYAATKSPLAELVANPISSVFFPTERKTYKIEPVPTLGLSSDSLFSTEKSDLSALIPKGKKYNVVIYLFESTAYKYYDLQLNGISVVPEMHKLAQNGFLAQNHIVNYPLSANALFNIMTSDYPMIGKKMVLETRPKIGVTTISELLKDNGYRTCYIHTGDLGYAGQKKFLENRKIDKFITFYDLIKDKRYSKPVGWGADERSMIDPAVDFMKQSPEPFFVVMSPMNPHHPYAVPDDSFKVFPYPENASRRERIWTDYLNSLHYADYCMGELVNRLESEGLMKDTLFIMIADHGEAFYQHNMNYNHPFFLYEENIHVPMIIYNKDIFKSNYSYSQITRHIDILPTITDILGIQDTEKREGVPIFSPRSEKLSLVHTSWKEDILAVRDVQWKYIIKMKDGSEELYDLNADPDEKNNIAALHPDIAAKYREYCMSGAGYINAFYESRK